jgi:glycosyltransferase involved in cell wall biosynthesis
MSVSIVIPAFNEEAYIFNCVSRIIALLKNRIDFELLVVDNASTDQTAAIVAAIAGVSLIRLDKKVTVSAARNIGWRYASYDVLVFIDADVLLTKQWVDELIELLGSHAEDLNFITGCRYQLSEQPGIIEKIWFASLKPSRAGYINSGNLITTRSVLNSTGGFAEDLITGEDVDFCLRAKKLGIALRVNTKFLANHEGYPKSLLSFFMRERWHGIGDLKSFRTFCSSKIALFSFLMIFAMIVDLVLIYLNSNTMVLYVSTAIVALNLFAVLYRFNRTDVFTVFGLFILNIVYSLARVSAIFYRRRV